MPEFRNPVLGGGDRVDHGDPVVLRYLDRFYLYHTGETSGRKGISVYSSPDLVSWAAEGVALEPAAHGWAYTDVWAPEVVYDRGTFYMYVAVAGEDGDAPPGHRTRRLGLARSGSPTGPFEWDAQPLVAEGWAIDGHPFRDDDGTLWLFYNRRINDSYFRQGVGGTENVVDQLLALDRLAGRPAAVSSPSQGWEYAPDRTWAWNEGAWVVKRRGRYFEMYSGGHFENAGYAIGIASSDDLAGPWRKSAENPIFRSGRRIVGVGHHSVVFGPDFATLYAVYHGYVDDASSGRKVHLDRFHWRGDRPAIAGPTEGPQPRPPGPVHDPDIPFLRAQAWARGGRVLVHGLQFDLDPVDVWHMVELTRDQSQIAVRVGGVLRYIGPPRSERRFQGTIVHEAVTSHLDDPTWLALPAGCVHRWPWRGSGPVELVAAVRGQVTVQVGDQRAEVSSAGFELVHLRAERADDVSATTHTSGSVITDLQLFAR